MSFVSPKDMKTRKFFLHKEHFYTCQVPEPNGHAAYENPLNP